MVIWEAHIIHIRSDLAIVRIPERPQEGRQLESDSEVELQSVYPEARRRLKGEQSPGFMSGIGR